MSTLRTIRHAAGAFLGDGAVLSESVAFGASALGGVAADTTAFAGARLDLAHAAEVREWIGGVAGWLFGEDEVADGPPVVQAGHALWPLLGDPGGQFDASRLADVVPAGAAWIVAVDPPRFFGQAAQKLERRGTERAHQLAARLRQPTGNLALAGRLVDTVALTLDADLAGLRMRLGCADSAGARQAQLVLQGWRLRRSLAESPTAPLFHDATVARAGTRVEMVFRGESALVRRVFAFR